MKKLVMAWSGGKDSAMALWRLQKNSSYRVTGLLTTVTDACERISMHGVRVALLEAQVEALGITLHKVLIPPHCSNEGYESAMMAALDALQADGVEAVGFGDLYLQDIRAYREHMLAPSALESVFPVWGEDTAEFAREIVGAGFQATLCCVDSRALGSEFAGRSYDLELLADLPDGVDPCGENGEFHTFVNDGPNFLHTVSCERGTRVEREGYWFFDIIPGDSLRE